MAASCVLFILTCNAQSTLPRTPDKLRDGTDVNTGAGRPFAQVSIHSVFFSVVLSQVIDQQHLPRMRASCRHEHHRTRCSVLEGYGLTEKLSIIFGIPSAPLPRIVLTTAVFSFLKCYGSVVAAGITWPGD